MIDNCETENRLSYCRTEYKQLWIFYQQLRKENEQLRKALETTYNCMQDSNTRKVKKIDWLQRLSESITGFMKHLEQTKYAEIAVEYKASVEKVLEEDEKIRNSDQEYREYQQTILDDLGEIK